MKVLCSECECSVLIANNDRQMRECHRRSPVWGNANNGATATAEWPRVRKDDFCFEGEQIPRVNKYPDAAKPSRTTES